MGKKQVARYLLNINSRTIHDASSNNKRCKLSLMQDCNKKLFDSYWEAKNYLPVGKKMTSPCSFCLGPDYEKTIQGE